MTVAQIDPHVVELAAMSDFSARLQKCALSSLTQQLFFNTWRDLRMRACRHALDNISCTCSELTGLSQAAINFAVGSINGILDGVSKSIHETAQGLLEAGSCSLDAAFKEREDPFASLQTEYKQLKFYQEVFGLVLSIACMYISICRYCACIHACVYMGTRCIYAGTHYY